MAETHAAAGAKHLQCVVVTPERAVLDTPADFVALPMYDGELGVLPGRAPLIGRLGIGELRVKHGGQVTHLFVDGGFAQVRGNTVTVLTPSARPPPRSSPTLCATRWNPPWQRRRRRLKRWNRVRRPRSVPA